MAKLRTAIIGSQTNTDSFLVNKDTNKTLEYY